MYRAGIMPYHFSSSPKTQSKELSNTGFKYSMPICLGFSNQVWRNPLHVPTLSKWSGVSLVVRMGDDLPSSHNITIFCPRTGDKTTKWIMELIKKQNDLDTENWRLIYRKNECGGSLISLGIDDNSCAKIISSDHKLRFRFGETQFVV
ncbi:GM11089 [Drosophila sechellia]|uniref:GM11089 n=1 Tax=Drosophila sechellia TaxID=7238 RepID=B4IN73_DROSE|nr:GM11089 [Drosophila sechellia]